jgi:hypothetical protein
MLHYRVCVDYDDDGIFETDEALTQAVLSLKWQIGQRQAHELVAPPARADIVVHDPEGHYSADGSLRLLGRRLRIACALSADALEAEQSALFTGYITALVPSAGDWQAPTSTLIAHDISASLEQTPANLPLLDDVSADVVLSRLIDSARLRPPKTYGRWLLGRAGHGELGRNTRFAVLAQHAFQQGVTRFLQVGALSLGASLRSAISALVTAERGRFFVDELGVLRFFKRHHLLQQEAQPPWSVTDSAERLAYAWGEQVIGRVRVRLPQLARGESEQVVWRASNPLRLEARSMRRHAIQFQDSAGRPSAAFALQTPAPTLDYQVSALTGLANSAAVTCQIVEVGARGAVLEWRNADEQALIVQAGAQVRATPLSEGAPLSIERLSRYAIAQSLPHTLNIDLPFSDSAETGDAIARYELARRGQWRGVVAHLTLDARRHPDLVQGARLYQRLRLTLSRPAHTSDYHIVGAEHEVRQGGAVHQVRYVLEAADLVRFWRLGAERLSQHSRLAY